MATTEERKKPATYIGAIDQGTSSSRFILFDTSGKIVDKHQIEITQHFPKPGWQEHEPSNILDTVTQCIDVVMKRNAGARVAAIGITNQRETTCVWDKNTGNPLYNALVWSDTRNQAVVDDIVLTKAQGKTDFLRSSCGLPFSTYFSAMKLAWLQKNVPAVDKALKNETALFGTVDSWLIWNLTGGKAHVTDVTNASRTMLMDLKTLKWDARTLDLLGIPASCLPSIRSCSEVYGHVQQGALQGVPVAGCVGDQQAAMLGQLCLEPGSAKNTYGTGCFMLMNTGVVPVQSKHGLLTTVCCKLGADAPATYALEGSVAVAGSAVQWLRDKVQLIQSARDIDIAAESVADTGGVYFVPAFSGLLSPHWRPDARGVLVGLTQYSGRPHICRAVLEASAYQTHDVIEAMENDFKSASSDGKKAAMDKVSSLKVDGGLANSDLLMQFQANLLQCEVVRPAALEATAAGACYAAGLAVGVWKDTADLVAKAHPDPESTTVFKPPSGDNTAVRQMLLKGWRKAVERSFGWVESK